MFLAVWTDWENMNVGQAFLVALVAILIVFLVLAIIILVTSLVNNLNAATSGIVHATGHMRDYQLWGSLVSICSVPISFFLLSFYNIPELAFLCVFVCSLLGHIICLFVVRRLIGMSLIRYCKEVIAPIIVVFTISFSITYPFHLIIDQDISRLFVVTLVSSATVLFTLFFIAFNKSERSIVVQIIKSFLTKYRITR